MENKGTFIDSDYQIVSRMSLNLLDISGLRSWSLAFIIAGLVHILYFSLLQFQNRIDQITQDGYSTIPIKIVSTHSKTVQPEVIAPEIIPAVRSKSELPNKTIQTSRVSKEFAPTSQITQKTKILPHPIAQPVIEKIDTLSKVPALTANITSTSKEIDVIKEQSEIPSRWALSDEQLNASLLDARGRPKYWQFEPDANYHRRICEGKIKSIDLSQDRKAEPCKKKSIPLPRGTRKSGSCIASYRILPTGHTHDIVIHSCTDQFFKAASLKAAQEWYYLPAVKNAKFVMSDVLHTRHIFRLYDEKTGATIY